MPFAMLLGRGDPDLVAAADGPSVAEEDAALLGAQVLDETESRMLAASRVATFGAGMLGDDAGMAALDGWARAVARRVDGIYIAIDMDCLDASGGWAVTMPEPDGLVLATAVGGGTDARGGHAGRRLRRHRDHAGERRRRGDDRRGGDPRRGRARLRSG